MSAQEPVSSPSNQYQPQSNVVPPVQQPVAAGQETVLPDVPMGKSQSEPTGTTYATPQKPSRKFPKAAIIGLVLVVLLVLVGALVTVVLPRLGSVVPQGNVELTWWGLWENETLVQPLIDEYKELHPNVTIKYIHQDKQDYRERLVNEFAKGEDGTAPDIFRFHNTWVPMFINELDKLPSEVMSAEEFSQTFYPVATSDLTTGSGLAGIPLMYDGLALFINTEIFTTYGKIPPRTWTEFSETAKELTIVDESGVIRQSGAALGEAENVDHWPEILGLLMLQNGANPANPSSDAGLQALRYFRRFRDEGIWDKTLPNSTLAFATGRLAMYIGPSWRAFEIREQNPNIAFQVLSVPQLPKDDPSEVDITYATYWVEGVWAKSKYTKQSWEFLKFLSSKESLQKLYDNATSQRGFGELYPRQDMKGLLEANPSVSGFIDLAPTAKSWYFASRTFDGPTGINTLVTEAYVDAVNSGSFALTAKNIVDVLVQYRLVAAPSTK
ncbi:hypothetical protein A2801_01785 [Candidatus Woesebacteria bacterium RIFCSPHIGHO2_01_FULL_41_10]|uniref:Extracellular solute-binding protein n=1 Tax=Candidatus Woesebacteria bacterium RIFCSPHIGHO2_01_FULL_41_10 TaxID=1802500 RepID=A0A1F7YMT0_9BACT|nr:MAG: hypothetical protein A2801_01785 [Candidatus Woesebacteria bacterium RIFCSPHIGHO2_01_FULL_41_10]